MCLDTVDRIYDPPKEEEVTGYKIFIERDGNLEPFCHNFRFRGFPPRFAPIGTWLTDESDKSITMFGNMGNYPSGSHVFLDAGTARYVAHIAGGTVYRVRVNKIVARGRERWASGLRYSSSSSKVLVCKEIFIEKAI